MTTVHLGFKAFDLHELACHFIARHAGLYAARDLEVRLLDTNFIPDEQLPPRTFHAACGAALVAWLKGARIRVVFVACDRPMFWLIGRPEIAARGSLAGLNIAGYPPGSPPAQLLRLLLRARGLHDDGGATVLAARDDAARLGLLRGGEVQAAVISSAVPQSRLRRRGLSVIEFFGAALRLPTTGLAVRESQLAAEPELARVMCRCYQQGLQLLRRDDPVARSALAEALECSAAEAAAAAGLLRDCYTADGRSSAAIQSQAIEAMRWALGTGLAPPAQDLYDYAALGHGCDERPAENA